MGICSTLWGKAIDFLIFNEDRTPEYVMTDENLLYEAQQELIQARSLFAQAEDPEMIDYAIFHLKAAEQRYDYLIRRIKVQRGFVRRAEKGE